MPTLPAAYRWIEAVRPQPRMIAEALKLFGVAEIGGSADCPVILGWAKEVGGEVERTYRADSIPWCGLFMAVVARRAGKVAPERPLWALNWARFGAAAPAPMLGDVLVFRRGGGGHVALYVGEDEEAFHVLGGNQADRVCFARLARSRLHAARRPAYRVVPASVRRYRLAAGGALSADEG
jgi:uncharacterized protein (TIGR02594 family)